MIVSQSLRSWVWSKSSSWTELEHCVGAVQVDSVGQSALPSDLHPGELAQYVSASFSTSSINLGFSLLQIRSGLFVRNYTGQHTQHRSKTSGQHINVADCMVKSLRVKTQAFNIEFHAFVASALPSGPASGATLQSVPIYRRSEAPPVVVPVQFGSTGTQPEPALPPPRALRKPLPRAPWLHPSL